MNKKQKKHLDFRTYLHTQVQRVQFRKHYHTYGKQLEIAYKIIQLRKQQKLSQSQFAKRIGTSQSNVARLEAGRENFTTELLSRIAAALGRELDIRFVGR